VPAWSDFPISGPKILRAAGLPGGESYLGMINAAILERQAIVGGTAPTFPSSGDANTWRLSVGDTTFWKSFSDALAALALLFVKNEPTSGMTTDQMDELVDAPAALSAACKPMSTTLLNNWVAFLKACRWVKVGHYGGATGTTSQRKGYSGSTVDFDTAWANTLAMSWGAGGAYSARQSGNGWKTGSTWYAYAYRSFHDRAISLGSLTAAQLDTWKIGMLSFYEYPANVAGSLRVLDSLGSEIANVAAVDEPGLWQFAEPNVAAFDNAASLTFGADQADSDIGDVKPADVVDGTHKYKGFVAMNGNDEYGRYPAALCVKPTFLYV
jgi:hypothetical protein